jgi:hypothetical protein
MLRLREICVIDHVVADVVVHRLDDGRRRYELSVVEILNDVEALALGDLRPGGQACRRRGRRPAAFVGAVGVRGVEAVLLGQ